MINDRENSYLNQFSGLKLFFEEYVVEQLLSPIRSHDKMKTYYPSQIIDLRFQVDYVTPKIIRYFEE